MEGHISIEPFLVKIDQSDQIHDASMYNEGYSKQMQSQLNRYALCCNTCLHAQVGIWSFLVWIDQRYQKVGASRLERSRRHMQRASLYCLTQNKSYKQMPCLKHSTQCVSQLSCVIYQKCLVSLETSDPQQKPRLTRYKLFSAVMKIQCSPSRLDAMLSLQLRFCLLGAASTTELIFFLSLQTSCICHFLESSANSFSLLQASDIFWSASRQ